VVAINDFDGDIESAPQIIEAAGRISAAAGALRSTLTKLKTPTKSEYKFQSGEVMR
jgi:hypothetical protein